MKGFCDGCRWPLFRTDRKFQVRIYFAILAGLAVFLASCSRHAGDSSQTAGQRAAVPVLVAKASSRDLPVEVQSIGNVQAYSLVSIRPQITGKIEKVHFEEGQEVKAGDLLFTLDPRQWEAELNQAQANLARDEAQLINARLTFLRTSNLFESKIASQQDFDSAEATYQGLLATLVADRAAISNAQVNLDYTAIQSPIDGRTGNLAVKAGNVVKSPDDVLVTITQIRPVYVSFSVPEQHLTSIRRRASQEKLPVLAFAPGETNNVARGELTFIDNTVDTNTGTILLKGTFSNEHHVLWPGQFVRTTLTLSNLAGVTVVPSQAVQSGQNGEFVFVVGPEDKVDARPVTTGITFDGVQVIQSGVKPGETVVTDGQLRLTPGSKVSIKSQGNENSNPTMESRAD
jgi:multidrug efflux system membrane fusion protein